MPNVFSPPSPPITATAATTITITTNPPTSYSPPRVLFRDNIVQPFKPKFYVDPDLLKTIRSYLNVEIPFNLILLATLYLYKNSLKYKAESLLKIMKNINNTAVRELYKKVIKSDNKVRALISALQEYTILSLKNINKINKYYFKPKLY